jgi:hypothetical protein
MRKLKTYIIGILKGSEMTNCHMATSCIKEAKTEAQKTNKNVYEFKNGKYYLRKIFYNPVRNLI